ncbi:ORF2 [Rhizoctonia solani megabasidiovirus 1]|nr:ORF2 [Rhizoctonia solani megabasidiovirus 1]
MATTTKKNRLFSWLAPKSRKPDGTATSQPGGNLPGTEEPGLPEKTSQTITLDPLESQLIPHPRRMAQVLRNPSHPLYNLAIYPIGNISIRNSGPCPLASEIDAEYAALMCSSSKVKAGIAALDNLKVESEHYWKTLAEQKKGVIGANDDNVWKAPAANPEADRELAHIDPNVSGYQRGAARHFAATWNMPTEHYAECPEHGHTPHMFQIWKKWTPSDTNNRRKFGDSDESETIAALVASGKIYVKILRCARCDYRREICQKAAYNFYLADINRPKARLAFRQSRIYRQFLGPFLDEVKFAKSVNVGVERITLEHLEFDFPAYVPAPVAEDAASEGTYVTFNDAQKWNKLPDGEQPCSWTPSEIGDYWRLREFDPATEMPQMFRDNDADDWYPAHEIIVWEQAFLYSNPPVLLKQQGKPNLGEFVRPVKYAGAQDDISAQLAFLTSHGFTASAGTYTYQPCLTAWSFSSSSSPVIAESDGYVALNVDSKAVIWSKQRVPLSSVPLPFKTYTKKANNRSIPQHDHRWLFPLAPFYLEVPEHGTMTYDTLLAMAGIIKAKFDDPEDVKKYVGAYDGHKLTNDDMEQFISFASPAFSMLHHDIPADILPFVREIWHSANSALVARSPSFKIHRNPGVHTMEGPCGKYPIVEKLRATKVMRIHYSSKQDREKYRALKRFHPVQSTIDIVLPYISRIMPGGSEKWARDIKDEHMCINDIYFEGANVYFQGMCQNGNASLVVHLKPEYKYIAPISFPFAVYVDWSKPHRSLSDVMFYLAPLSSHRIQIPANTPIDESVNMVPLLRALAAPECVKVWTFSRKKPTAKDGFVFAVTDISFMSDPGCGQAFNTAALLGTMELWETTVTNDDLVQNGMSESHFGSVSLLVKPSHHGNWERVEVANLTPRRYVEGNVQFDPTVREKVIKSMPAQFQSHLSVILTHAEFKPAFRIHNWCHHLSCSDYQDDLAHVLAESEHFVVLWHPSTLTIWSKECVPVSPHALPFDTESSYLSVRSYPDHDHRWLEHPASKGRMYARIPKGATPDASSPEWKLYPAAGMGKYNGKPHAPVTCGCKDEPANRFNWSGKDICRDCFMTRLIKGETPFVYSEFIALAASRTWLFSFADFEKVSPYITDFNSSFGDVEEKGVRYGSVIGRSPTMFFGQVYQPHDSMQASIWLSPRPGTTSAQFIQFPFPVYASTHNHTYKDLAGIYFQISALEAGYQKFEANHRISIKDFQEGWNPIWHTQRDKEEWLGITVGPIRRHTWTTDDWAHYTWNDGRKSSKDAYWKLLTAGDQSWHVCRFDPTRQALVQRQCGVNMMAGEIIESMEINQKAAQLLLTDAKFASLEWKDAIKLVMDNAGLTGVKTVGVIPFKAQKFMRPWYSRLFMNIQDKTKGDSGPTSMPGPTTTISAAAPPIHIPRNPPALLPFARLVQDGPASVSTAPAAMWMPIGWHLKMGLPAFELEDAYRGQETSLLRHRDNKGLHWLNIPTDMPSQPISPYLLGIVRMIETIARKGTGKIVITANPDGPPPPPSLGFTPIAINGQREDWCNIPMTLAHPRMNAFARLLVMMTGPDVKEWWIVNGRGVEQQLLPRLNPGRLTTANRYDCCPLVLYSTRSDMKFRQPELFQAWFDISWAYGTDEKVLADYPLSVELFAPIVPVSFWIFPEEPCWPDVHIYQGEKRIFEGPLNRLTAHRLISKPKALPTLKQRKLGLDQRYNIARIEEDIKGIQPRYIGSPFEYVEDRNKALLVAVYGTRGDIVPIEYLVRVLMLLGAPVYMYKVAELSALELRKVVAGDFRGQIINAFKMLGLGKVGFKAVLTPQLAVAGNSASFELTPWKHIDPVRAVNPIMEVLINGFIAMKTPALQVGVVHGSNTPRSANGYQMLIHRPQPSRPKKVGWVTGSDGINAVPEFIRSQYEQITDTDHHNTAFIGYTHVWCNGGQGIMQTLRSRDVIPLVYAPGFDRSLNLPCTPEALAESDYSALVATVQSLGIKFGPQMTYSWRTYLRQLIPRPTIETFLWPIRIAIVISQIHLPFADLLKFVVSFPSFLVLAKTGWLDMFIFLVGFFVSYPMATSGFGLVVTLFTLVGIEIVAYCANLANTLEAPTELSVSFTSRFPFVSHVKIIDHRMGEVAHMSWQGDRKNLINPFRGEIQTVIPAQNSNEYRFPIVINYPLVRNKMLTKAAAYSPWFNCQTVLPEVTDYNFVVTAVVMIMQMFVFPFTILGYTFWILKNLIKPVAKGLPADDFFRFGNQEQYDLAIANREAELQNEALVAAIRKEVNRAVTCEDEAEPEPADKPADAIEWDPSSTEYNRISVLCHEAFTELAENPSAYSLDDFVLHAAIQAEAAVEQDIPRDLAYHTATLALHEFIIRAPVPAEVEDWRRKFAPVRHVRDINVYLQRLSIFLRKQGKSLPPAARSFLMALYRWIEGLGGKLKTYAIKIYHACVYIGEQLAAVSTFLWEEFSDFLMPLFDYLFGGKMSKRIKAVWALGGVAKNPALAAQRRLQESYAFAHYERHQGFNQAYRDALEDIVNNLPKELGPNDARAFRNSKYKGNLKGPWVRVPTREQFKWFLDPREQFRPANAPASPVMSIPEALAAYYELDEKDEEVVQITNELNAICKDEAKSEVERISALEAKFTALANDYEALKTIKHDAFLTQQVLTRLGEGTKQTVDHAHEVKRHPKTMFEMQERYAYLGTKFDPKEEAIPDTFAQLSDERKALYDQIAAKIVAKWPERYQNRRLTSPEALMNYLEWDRGTGPMFEMSKVQRDKAREIAKVQPLNPPIYDTTKRFRMWEAGLGAAVIRKAYEDARKGKVDVQQFAAFVKSQPTPVKKLARGVTFMPITQWFKGMMECFAQNQRVTWRTTYIGKNMPGGQHMKEFFEKVRGLPVMGEGDATQMDSRFEAGILYGLGRIAHHAWTWGSPYVENGAAIASHKAERYRALADGWIFNLHVSQESGLKPRYHLVNSLHRESPGNPIEIRTESGTRYYKSRDPIRHAKVVEASERLRLSSSAPFDTSSLPTLEQLALEAGLDLQTVQEGLSQNRHTRPILNNVTQKIRGGATGLEDTTDLNTDGKKIGTIAALVTFGNLIGKPISIDDAMDESKYLEAHTSDDNIFGIDPMRLYGITPEEFARRRGEFMQAFAENNLNMTFMFHEERDQNGGTPGRWLEYLSYFSRNPTVQDRMHIDRINKMYRERGIFGPDKSQNELLDPLTRGDIDKIVYINTKAMDSRQTAQNAFKQHTFRDRYLLAAIQRDIGQSQLKAFNFESYLGNLSTYHTNAVRYLAGAFEPSREDSAISQGVHGLCRSKQSRTPIIPTDPALEAWIQSHFHPEKECVGKGSTYVRYRIDGNVMTKTFPKHLGRLPDEFRARLQELKMTQFPAYAKVVYDHFKPTKTPLDKAQRMWKKVNKGVLGADEAAKEVLDDMRRMFEKIPKKFTRGITPTLDMVHPDEIWEGSGRVEAAIYLNYEAECNKSNSALTASGYQRLVNQSPYSGCCNAAAAFHHFQTPEGSAELHKHPEYVWRNATVAISFGYYCSWYIERKIMSLPFIGFAWALMMFYLIDISKAYAVLGLLRWHTTMRADPYIAGLLPRDVYIHSKRFSDFIAGFVPIEAFYILRFDLILDPISEWFSRAARMIQHGMHITPMTSTQPGAIQNEWDPVAAQIMEELFSLMESNKPAVTSVKGPTGTGKSTFLVYALMTRNMFRGGKTYLIAPFTVLRDDWGLPSWFAIGSHDTPEHERMSRYQVLKGNTTKRSNATLYLATYGHFQQRIQSGELTSNDLVCLDETHLGGPAQVMVEHLLIKHNIPYVCLSATPSPVKGLNHGRLIDATDRITQKNNKLVVVFPESTPQLTMYQQMLKSDAKDPQLGFSHREMAQRCIMKVNTLADIAKTLAGLEELRKADPFIPMAFEFSRNTFKAQKQEREDYCNKGRYIIVATDIIGVGYDIKPAAWSIIDNGLTIQEHQGFLQRPMNSTRDQMEQFHGRVGRNSSDRNGLIYCTDNAGTGVQAQQYGSGSFYVEPAVCKAIGVPRLMELPYQGPFKKFNYFDIRADITGPLRQGLCFTMFAALSGVDPREMPTFYRRYAEEGWTLPEEYEWLSSRMKESGQVMFNLPAWSVIHTVIAQGPFLVRIEGNKIVGAVDHNEDGLALVGPIYPRAGEWYDFMELSKNRNVIRTTAKITTESEAFEAIRVELEKTIVDLRKKVANKSNNRALVATRLQSELQLRNSQAKYTAVTVASEVSAQIDAIKPQIVAGLAKQAEEESIRQLWSNGMHQARQRASLPAISNPKPPVTAPTAAAVRSAILTALQEEDALEEDDPRIQQNVEASKTALEKALAQLKTRAPVATSRKEARKQLNADWNRWCQLTQKLRVESDDIAAAWTQLKKSIITNLHAERIPIKLTKRKDGNYVIHWSHIMPSALEANSVPCRSKCPERLPQCQSCKETTNACCDDPRVVCINCYEDESKGEETN